MTHHHDGTMGYHAGRQPPEDCQYRAYIHGHIDDPTCFQRPEFDITWRYECPGCGANIHTVSCEQHTHLAMERAGQAILSVLPIDYDPSELDQWRKQLTEGTDG